MTVVEGGERSGTEWVKVAALEDVPEGRVKSVRVGNRKFALVNVEGSLYAMDSLCPHKYGPLDQGDLNKANEVACPWHKFRFDPKTGECTAPVGAFPALETPAVRVVEGNIEIST